MKTLEELRANLEDATPENYEILLAEYELASSRCDELDEENRRLKEYIRLLTARRFGASSEKSNVDADQVNMDDLFNEAECNASPNAQADENAAQADVQPEEASDGIESPAQEKPKPRKRPESLKTRVLTLGLPETTVDYFPKDTQSCPECGGTLHEMSTQTRTDVNARCKMVLPTFRVQIWYNINVPNDPGTRRGNRNEREHRRNDPRLISRYVTDRGSGTRRNGHTDRPEVHNTCGALSGLRV